MSAVNGQGPLLQLISERAAEHYVPLQAVLELTYHCNLRCRHCYVDLDLRQGQLQELGTGEWCAVLDQLVAAGTLEVMLTGGEVLLRPDFFEIAEAVKARRCRLGVLTNGTLLDDERIARLCTLEPFSVGVSLYGATASTHDALTLCPGSFERTVAAIAKLHQRGTRVSVQVTFVQSNLHEIEATRDLVASLGAECNMSFTLVPTKGCSHAPQMLEASSAEQLAPLAACDTGPRAPRPTICNAGLIMCSIAPNGDLYPCLIVPMCLGNLRERSFRELWWDHPCDDLVYLRSLTDGDLEGCGACANASFCERCLGVALSETGSLTACPPSAGRYAALRARIHAKGGSAK
jgi:radical SAM protein with 4Fe4S-binding SPASM domain